MKLSREEILGAAQRLISQVHRHLDNDPSQIDITQAINLLERAMVRLESLRNNPWAEDEQDAGVRHS
jgi:hypothetical protein